jgi:hypothetical protein
MAERFGASVTVDRPVEEVFAFLADGENDEKFSPRIVEIEKTTNGPDIAPAAGGGTELSFFNMLEGCGFGKLIFPLVIRSARRGADDFAVSIKRAIESS